MTKRTWILAGLGLMGVALVIGLAPKSEKYSDYGFWSNQGAVDVNCGSPFDRNVRADFDDWSEQADYEAEVSTWGEPAIFEGQTATQVCDEALRGAKTAAIVAAVAGTVALLIGFTRTSSSSAASAAAAASSSSSSSSSAPAFAAVTSPDAAAAAPAPPPAGSPLAGVRAEAWLLFAGLLVYLIVDLDEVYVLGSTGATWRKLVVVAGLVAVVVFALGRRLLASAVAVAAALSVLLLGTQVLVSGREGWQPWPLFLADVALVVGTHRCVRGFGRRQGGGDLLDLQPAVLGAAGAAGLFGLLMFRDRLGDSFRYVFAETAHWVGLAAVVALLIVKVGTRPAALAAASAAALAALSLPDQERFGGIRYPTMLSLLALAGIAGLLLVKLAGGTPTDVAPPAPAPPAAALLQTPQTPQTPSVPDALPVPATPVESQQPPRLPPPTAASVPTIETPELVWGDGRPLRAAGTVVIGRDPAAVETDGAHTLVPVPGDGLISKTHLAIGHAPDGSLWLEDRYSTNGVTVAGNAVSPGVRVRLGVGDEIRFGGQVLRVGARVQPRDDTPVAPERPVSAEIAPLAADVEAIAAEAVDGSADE